MNRRIVFTIRPLGTGVEGINIFSGLMDISQDIAIRTYDRVIQHIHEAVSIVFNTSKKAVLLEQFFNKILKLGHSERIIQIGVVLQLRVVKKVLR